MKTQDDLPDIKVGRLYTDERASDSRGYGVVIVTKVDDNRVEFTGPEVVDLEARFWITPDDFVRWFEPVAEV